MSLAAFSNLLVLPHSVFALPFAVGAYLLAYQRGRLVAPALPLWAELLAMVIAVVAARSAAMGFNRLVDADLDALNPRTRNREIPAGRVTRGQAWTLVLASTAIFLCSAYALGRHCFVLAPFVLGVLLAYSLCKRYGAYAHVVLGLALALAPGGAWWILRPAVELTPLLLMTSVLFWVAGFDILYSCQDVGFDRTHGMFSVPAAVGIEYAMHISRWFHVLCVAGFLTVGISAGQGSVYFLGVIGIAASLVYEHCIVSPFDLSRINQAFFTLNGIISVVYLVCLTAGMIL